MFRYDSDRHNKFPQKYKAETIGRERIALRLYILRRYLLTYQLMLGKKEEEEELSESLPGDKCELFLQKLSYSSIVIVANFLPL